jgi:hypothetical protein
MKSLGGLCLVLICALGGALTAGDEGDGAAAGSAKAAASAPKAVAASKAEAVRVDAPRVKAARAEVMPAAEKKVIWTKAVPAPAKKVRGGVVHRAEMLVVRPAPATEFGQGGSLTVKPAGGVAGKAAGETATAKPGRIVVSIGDDAVAGVEDR